MSAEVNRGYAALLEAEAAAPAPRLLAPGAVCRLDEFTVHVFGTGESIVFATEMLAASGSVYAIAKTYALSDYSYVHKVLALNAFTGAFDERQLHIATLLGNATEWLEVGRERAGHDKIIVLFKVRRGVTVTAEALFAMLLLSPDLGGLARVWCLIAHNDNLSNGAFEAEHNVQAGLALMADEGDLSGEQADSLAVLAHTMLTGPPCDLEIIKRARALIGETRNDEARLAKAVSPTFQAALDFAQRNDVALEFAEAMEGRVGIKFAEGSAVLAWRAHWTGPDGIERSKGYCCLQLAALSRALKAYVSVALTGGGAEAYFITCSDEPGPRLLAPRAPRLAQLRAANPTLPIVEWPQAAPEPSPEPWSPPPLRELKWLARLAHGDRFPYAGEFSCKPGVAAKLEVEQRALFAQAAAQIKGEDSSGARAELTKRKRRFSRIAPDPAAVREQEALFTAARAAVAASSLAR